MAEEDFPVTPDVSSVAPPRLTPAQTEELPLLDIPFMLISFLLSQVTPVWPLHYSFLTIVMSTPTKTIYVHS